jgi:siroheme synthase-like protein
MAPEERNTLFPVFMKISRLQTLVVGGGAVGLEKLQALLSNAPEAPVTLVAKQILPAIKDLAGKAPHVALAERPFEADDLSGRDLVIIATNDTAENKRIHAIAKSMGILVNVADTPDLCDFYLSSIVQKGNMKIAISTNGKSPTIAKRIREVLSEMIPDEMEEVLASLGQIRNRLRGDFSEKVRELNKITSVLVNKHQPEKKEAD